MQTLSGDYETTLSTTVTKIRYSDKNVQIEAQNGQSLSFDAVIVTVPLGVLKQETITFEPSLPRSKLDAITRIGMGTLDKLYLEFEEPFWDEDATVILTPDTNLPQGQFNYWVNFQKYLDKPIIMAFNAGESALALSKQSDEKVIESALRTLSIAYPG